MTEAPPSRNKAADGTLKGLVNTLKNKLGQRTEDMLPAKVLAYDRDTNRAQVQPLIVVVNTLNEQVPRAQIASVPVLQIGGGGYVVSVPIKTGDLGWIKASDRDISLFKKNYVQSPPNTQRTHNFADGLFIPDSFMKDVIIDEEDAENLVIQKNDSTVRIALWADRVKITAPQVILDTPTTTCTGDLLVEGSASIVEDLLVVGTSSLLGNVNAFSDITVFNNMTVEGSASIGGIDFETHVHGGVETGAGTTGVPE